MAVLISDRWLRQFRKALLASVRHYVTESLMASEFRPNKLAVGETGNQRAFQRHAS